MWCWHTNSWKAYLDRPTANNSEAVLVSISATLFFYFSKIRRQLLSQVDTELNMERYSVPEEKTRSSPSPPQPSATMPPVALPTKLPLKVPMAVGSIRSNSPKSTKLAVKPAFNRPFKQATFENRGKEDGSSNLYVSFTSESSHKSRPDLAAQIAQRAAAAAQSKAKNESVPPRTTHPRTIQPQPVPQTPPQKIAVAEGPSEPHPKGIVIPTHPIQAPNSAPHHKTKSKSGKICNT